MAPPQITWPTQTMFPGRAPRRDLRPGTLGLPRVGPVDVPVAGNREQPGELLTTWPQQEPADDALPALVVAVQQVEGQRLPAADRLSGGVQVGMGGIAERALPEAAVPGRDVEVPRLAGKAVQVAMLVLAVVARMEQPAVQHADPGAGVAQRRGQIDHPVLVIGLGYRPAAGEHG